MNGYITVSILQKNFQNDLTGGASPPPPPPPPQNPAVDESWQLRDLGIAVLNAFPTLSQHYHVFYLISSQIFTLSLLI
jgi:hypothetical protein